MYNLTPLVYTIDHSQFIVFNQKEEPISIQHANVSDKFPNI